MKFVNVVVYNRLLQQALEEELESHRDAHRRQISTMRSDVAKLEKCVNELKEFVTVLLFIRATFNRVSCLVNCNRKRWLMKQSRLVDLVCLLGLY